MTKPFDIETLLREVEIIFRKQDKKAKDRRGSGLNISRSVCVVENDPEFFNRIAIEFLNAGYILNFAKSGVMAVEKISSDLPELVLMKYNLSDISGDMVILKLQHMSKTMDVRFILYYSKSEKYDNKILEKIAERCGLERIVQCQDPKELLQIVNHTFVDKK